jgi:hypothetical protein
VTCVVRRGEDPGNQGQIKPEPSTAVSTRHRLADQLCSRPGQARRKADDVRVIHPSLTRCRKRITVGHLTICSRPGQARMASSPVRGERPLVRAHLHEPINDRMGRSSESRQDDGPQILQRCPRSPVTVYRRIGFSLDRTSNRGNGQGRNPLVSQSGHPDRFGSVPLLTRGGGPIQSFPIHALNRVSLIDRI